MLIGGVAAVGGVAGAVLVLPTIGAGIAAVTGTLAAKGAVATATAMAAKSVGAAGVAGGTYAAARTETAGKVASQVKEVLAPDVKRENENGNGGEDEGDGTKNTGNTEGFGKDDGEQGNSDAKDVTNSVDDLKEDGCHGGENEDTVAKKEEEEAAGGGGWGLWASTIKSYVNIGLYGDDEAVGDTDKDGEKKEGVVEDAGSQTTSSDDKAADEACGSSDSNHVSDSENNSGGWGLWASQMKDMFTAAVYGGEEENTACEENCDTNRSVKDKQNVAVEVGIQVSCDDEDNGTNASIAENLKEIGEDAEKELQEEINNNDAKDIKDGVDDVKEESCSGGESSSGTGSSGGGDTSDVIHDKKARNSREHTDSESTDMHHVETVGDVVDDNNMTELPSGDNVVEDGEKDTSDDAENDVGKVGIIVDDGEGIELDVES